MARFDASAWFRHFEACGGWYVVAADGRIFTGYRLDNNDAEEACRLMKDVATPERKAAVRQYLIGRP